MGASIDDDILDLYQQVYARPHDDELRRVLADALLAIDDPRGELIQLQFNAGLDHQRHTMRLLQQRGLTWLGALRGAVIPLAYERGFLASCQALAGSHAAIGQDEWSTVHTVELDPEDPVPPAFVVHPVMRSLRRITGAGAEVLAWLPSQTLPPTLVELATACPWGTVRALFGALSHLPLQVIEIRGGMVLRRGANGAWDLPAEAPEDEVAEVAAGDDDDDEGDDERFDDVDE